MYVKIRWLITLYKHCLDYFCNKYDDQYICYINIQFRFLCSRYLIKVILLRKPLKMLSMAYDKHYPCWFSYIKFWHTIHFITIVILTCVNALCTNWYSFNFHNRSTKIVIWIINFTGKVKRIFFCLYTYFFNKPNKIYMFIVISISMDSHELLY